MCEHPRWDGNLCKAWSIAEISRISLHMKHSQEFMVCRMETLKQLAADGISTATCDVTSAASVAACVEGVSKQAGAIDVLINNAGKALFLPCLSRMSLTSPR